MQQREEDDEAEDDSYVPDPFITRGRTKTTS